MREILARWRYRRDWRAFVRLMWHHARRGHIHALDERRRLEPDPDPWREQGLRAAAAVQLMYSRDYDPVRIIGDDELGLLVRCKLDVWHAGVWEGKKGIAPCPDMADMFRSPTSPTTVSDR